MNKTELVKSVAAQAGLSDHKTEKVINAVFDTIKQQLADGGEVSIVGFGVFHVSERAERQPAAFGRLCVETKLRNNKRHS